MLNNFCKIHQREVINYCKIHKKYLCSDCICESVNCFTKFTEIKNDDNNSKNNTDDKNKIINNNEKNNNNNNNDFDFTKFENKYKILENKIISFKSIVLQLKEILENYLIDNKKIFENIKNLIKKEKRKKKKNLNFIKNLGLNNIDDITKKIDFYINETLLVFNLKFSRKLFKQLYLITNNNNDNDKNSKNNNNNNINFINNNTINIKTKENENIKTSIKENKYNIENNKEILETIIMDSYFSHNNNDNIKNEENYNKTSFEMLRVNSKKIEKIATIILFKKKYITYVKNNSDIINFELLSNKLNTFSNKIITFSTSQKNINYIKELNDYNLLTASNDKTIKIFSIDFNKENPGQLLKQIKIQKMIIKAIESSNLLFILINNNKSKEPILNMYNYNINIKNKNLQESKKLFEKSTPNDVIYIKNDKFGLQENFEEFAISFAKEERVIFYDIKKEFKKTIIGNIKCSKKKDTMKIYNDILIIGGQNIFYFIDFYTKKVIFKNKFSTIVHSLNIINNIIIAGSQNGNLHIFQITNDNKLEKITQKKLQNNNIVNYLLCNENNKLIYAYYYPFIDIMNINA